MEEQNLAFTSADWLYFLPILELEPFVLFVSIYIFLLYLLAFFSYIERSFVYLPSLFVSFKLK
jgi:hypothetical protein